MDQRNGTPDTNPHESTLRRLGVRELEERMELSPLLADAGIEGADDCECTCRCDSTPAEGRDMPVAPDVPGEDLLGRR